jgi:CheY-like chemotaxis protein
MTQTTPPTHLVLYADDDIDDIKFVEESFSETTQNIELVTTYNGLDLVRYLEGLSQFEPDPCLIILDVNMPLMNGKEALIKIRQMNRYHNIPVVLFTTSSTDFDRNFAKKYNAGFVTKPLDNRQMKNITDRFIEHCTDEVQKHIRKTYS